MLEMDHLRQIFSAALKRVDPFDMIVDHVRMQGSTLIAEFDGERHEADLNAYDALLVLGAGKASARMAKALEFVLGDRITGGLVCVKYGHAEPLKRVEVIESGHPTPDEHGVEAARRMADLARKADAKTLALTCISGGGSALLPSPLIVSRPGAQVALTLADKQGVTRALLACGADIGEINTVRKHLSGLKGGRFLKLLSPARSLNFILSDVVGDRLDTIASGLTCHDDTTFADAMAVIKKYRLATQAPREVIRAIELGLLGRIAETPKRGDPVAAKAENILIGSNRAALLAAQEKARALGYHTSALTCALTGEARQAAKFLYGVARDVRNSELLARRPAFVVAGGETVVTLNGPGTGGRNQEMALAFLAELARDERGGQGIHFLSAATDGGDGPTDAAGAFASAEVLRRARQAGLSIEESLNRNDSYTFFDALGRLHKTGPTMTNVCDLYMLIVT
ncbi:glycerate kinase [Fundidesulfovibrio butyratiphilus]